ncbi:MAG: hypothetical protein IPP12_17890 [Nitrospira sp.]|nr:hypothetical protein [Nitrospira sp.]
MTSSIQLSLPLALIVDDDATFRMLSYELLEQGDLRVEDASSGEAAVASSRVHNARYHHPRLAKCPVRMDSPCVNTSVGCRTERSCRFSS